MKEVNEEETVTILLSIFSFFLLIASIPTGRLEVIYFMAVMFILCLTIPLILKVSQRLKYISEKYSTGGRVICPLISTCKVKVEMEKYLKTCSNLTEDAYKKCTEYINQVKELKTPLEWSRILTPT